jgi:RNA polymerase sigma factor (sigma-70 family)
LIERFLVSRDQAAFELLVWRHGPLVLGVCRRILGDVHDAEDAFQATFFALARKAGTIGRRGSLSSWLYKVAYRIALRARANRARHKSGAVPLNEEVIIGQEPQPADQAARRDLRPVMDAEISRLPEKYRTPLILCYFQGKSNEEAAATLGCPKGTVLSRLARGKQRLRRLLEQRGLTLAGWPIGVLLLEQGRTIAEVSPVLVNGAVLFAILHRAARAAAGLSSGPEKLAESVLGELRYPRRLVFGIALLLLLAAGGIAWAAGWLPSGWGGSNYKSQSTVPGCHKVLPQMNSE